jgi:hypothetical protein
MSKKKRGVQYRNRPRFNDQRNTICGVLGSGNLLAGRAILKVLLLDRSPCKKHRTLEISELAKES